MLSFATALFLIGGCATDNKEKVTTKDDVKKEMKEAAEASKDYLKSEYDAVVNDIEGFAQKTEDKVAELKKEAKNAKGEAKVKMEKRAKDIEQKSDELKSKLEEYKNATAEKKEEIKQEINKLKEALDASFETFKEEMK